MDTNIAEVPIEFALETTNDDSSRIVLTTSARNDFFDRVVESTRSKLPTYLANFSARRQAFLLKVFYENERVHFEVALHGSRDLIEVGLHFEDGPVSSAAFLQFFDRRIVELKHGLGADLELERWTASWGRLFYLVPLERFDARKAEECAVLLSRLIAALQPLVEEADVPPERVAETRSGPWRSWRRSRG